MPPTFRCPKCGAVGDATPDAQGVLTCAKCGIKLRPRTPAPAEAPLAPAPPASPKPAESASAEVPAVAAPPAATLDTLLEEMRALRKTQQEILSLLRARPAGATGGEGFPEDDEPPPERAAPPPVRSRRRKSVLLVDDDAASRSAAVAALEAAEVPVRVVTDGSAAIAAIADDKPDVVAIELDMAGAMPGKDTINMIKATMEWVDVPIVLYTRAAVGGQKEARTIHGADEYVAKGPDGPQQLVARVIALFRRA